MSEAPLYGGQILMSEVPLHGRRRNEEAGKLAKHFQSRLAEVSIPHPGTTRRTVGFYGGPVSYERVSPVLNPDLLSTEAAPPFFSLIRTFSAWSGQVEESFYEYPTIFNILWVHAPHSGPRRCRCFEVSKAT